MDAFGELLAQYGWLGVAVLLLIGGFAAIALGKLVPGVWVTRWLDDKDKIIDRSLNAFEKLSEAVEKNTDTVEKMAVELPKSVDEGFRSIQRIGETDHGGGPR